MIPYDGEMAISEFEDKAIRKVFQDGEWFFSISDLVGAVLGETSTAELTRARDALGFM